MTKTLKYLLPAMALGMVACSNEIPGDSTLPGSELTGKTAYMKINISSAETTRAVEDGGLKYGDASEHDVNDAKFIFFDAEGNFVTTASVWTGGTNGNTPNVEFMGNNVIVLKNLNEKPVRYLLTVLNLPDFEPSFTLTETALKLQDHRNVISDKNYHVMSTSTYYATGEDARHDNKYPYVTVVNPSDYMVQPVEANMADLNINELPTVDIYVERLSAKFQLGVGDNITTAGEPVVLESGKRVLYPIRATIGGGNNGQLGGSDDNIGADQLYVEFLGWGLNATESHSFISKQIGADWATKEPFADWNDPFNYRSYWAMSHLYGENPSDHLNYYTYNEILSQSTIGGKALYANENTNTAAVLFPDNAQKVVPARVTHVVVAARLTDKDGKALDMIRSTGGEMFTKEAYIANIFNKVNPQLYYIEGDKYIQISPEDAQLDWTRDATGHVSIKSNGFNKIVYKDKDTEATVDDLNTLLASAQSGYEPEVFNGGMMYYTIPIEHLAALATGDTPAAPNVEGYYGVVRNHWYVLTINNLARIGHGVFDPDKDKIKVEDPEDETYLLGAKINILSWKVLNQSVNL